MLKYSARQADLHFASNRRVWGKVGVGSSVQFIDTKGYLTNGNVVGKCGGIDPRLVVEERDGSRHYFRDINRLLIFSDKHKAFVAAAML